MMFFHDFAEAQASIQRALALDPSSAYAHDIASWFADTMGRNSEAIAESSKAVELDPLSVRYHYDLANCYFLARQYSQSIQQANRALEIDPRDSVVIQHIGWVYETTGNYQGAIEQWVKNERIIGNERRAEEIEKVFAKSGYPGYARLDG
jgi:tetratricopeptide (TPR) repeat protein